MNNQRNIGLQMLRMILALWVVAIHCYYFHKNGKGNFKRFLDKKMFHVPTFIFISFFYYHKHLIERNISKIRQKFRRLLIPYIIWPLIFLIINNIGIKHFNLGIFKRFITPKDYFFQIIYGSRYYSNFWYLADVIFLTLLFTIFAFLFNNSFLFMVQLLGFLSYKIHHSMIYKFFRENGIFNISLLIGIQIIPIAVTGLSFGASNITKKLKKSNSNIIINILFFYTLLKFDIFKSQDGFLYPLVELNTIAAINLFLLFYFLPFEIINNKKTFSFLNQISSYTGGIYYFHYFLRFYFSLIFNAVKKGTFFGFILVYISSYLICFFFCILFGNTVLKYLFL